MQRNLPKLIPDELVIGVLDRGLVPNDGTRGYGGYDAADCCHRATGWHANIEPVMTNLAKQVLKITGNIHTVACVFDDSKELDGGNFGGTVGTKTKHGCVLL